MGRIPEDMRSLDGAASSALYRTWKARRENIHAMNHGASAHRGAMVEFRYLGALEIFAEILANQGEDVMAVTHAFTTSEGLPGWTLAPCPSRADQILVQRAKNEGLFDERLDVPRYEMDEGKS